MSSPTPPPEANLAPPTHKRSRWKLVFRIIRWSTYAGALLTIVLALHKSAPPAVETSPEAEARAEKKLEQVGQSVGNGQAAELRLDESELNSYLASHLALEPSGKGANSPAAPQADPNSALSGTDVEQMRSNVRDVKVQMIRRPRARLRGVRHARQGFDAAARGPARVAEWLSPL